MLFFLVFTRLKDNRSSDSWEDGVLSTRQPCPHWHSSQDQDPHRSSCTGRWAAASSWRGEEDRTSKRPQHVVHSIPLPFSPVRNPREGTGLQTEEALGGAFHSVSRAALGNPDAWREREGEIDLQINSPIKHLGIIERWFYKYSRQGYHGIFFFE